ncbi:MAG: 2-dehydro-3-deoxygluconokinase [candidate division WS2 bacterium]|nr:2-dehydro-3-deoxygluconokinase [Candidatus Psychracetigena formicireducens]
MAKVVTMGEIMLRLSTPNYSRFVQAKSFDIVYGGGEANVAVSLANYGHDVYFVTKLPKHEIGQSAVNDLRKYGVNTDYIVRGGDRVGIYFLETGASMRPSKVIYDRTNSAIAGADSSEFDFNKVFKDASWFHWSGITPAISDKSAKLIETALIAAKKYDVTVSVDLNFRKKLWTTGQAQRVMTKLMKYVDVCIGNEEDAEKCLGLIPGDTDVTTGNLKLEGYKCILKEMQEKFNFKYAATTLRESYSASDNGWSAIMYDGNEFYTSHKYEVRIVDRVGGGDAFAGGLIHGLLTKNNMKDALEYAVAASAIKHTILGDFNLISEEEVERLVAGDASGRVQR